jgi:hypothetical protein
MKPKKPLWWNSLLPWRTLKPCLPLATVSGATVAGLVVHRQGQYGENQGNWVDGDPTGYATHFGLDIIGWLANSEPHVHILDKQIVCCSPLDGVIAWTGADEHGSPSINMLHSSRTAKRRRFSFFGDLEEVYVRAGQRVSAGTPLGRPCVFKRRCRFFHFGMGYEIRRNGKWCDIFIDPGPALKARIVVRPNLPW